jgi:hypothetical protein
VRRKDIGMSMYRLPEWAWREPYWVEESCASTTSKEDLAIERLKCYCGFTCESESELKAHITTTHGTRDGDWKTWVEG